MKKKDIEKILKAWFYKKKKRFISNKNLFDEGVIDSFEVIDFISYVEEKFKIKLVDARNPPGVHPLEPQTTTKIPQYKILGKGG